MHWISLHEGGGGLEKISLPTLIFCFFFGFHKISSFIVLFLFLLVWLLIFLFKSGANSHKSWAMAQLTIFLFSYVKATS